MDVITKVPGLQHISEDIFKLLDKKSLMNGRLTNLSWKNVSKTCSFWLKKMKLEGWTTLAKNIEDRQIAKDLTRSYLDLENFQSDTLNHSKWKVLLTKLENYHNQKDFFVLLLIKIYNNRTIIYNLYPDKRQILLPLELVSCLREPFKYPDLVEALCEHENPSSKLDIDYFFLDCSALANATQMLIDAFDGFTGLVEKLSKKYEYPVVETSRG